MADDQDDPKKTFPNSFIWFLMAAFLFALFVQNFIESKAAKVSFSYQLEHLVNLQLLQPEDNHKIALNDNLVTFSGKFRDRQTEEGKNRFKYLELLNTNHELTANRNRVENELKNLRVKVIDAAEWFLTLSKTPLPKEGYVIIDDSYDTPELKNQVVITKLPPKNAESFPEVKSIVDKARADPTNQNISYAGQSLLSLIRNFRSSLLGIGNENLKQSLREIESSVNGVINETSEPAKQLEVYGKALNDVEEVINQLNAPEDNVRLSKLRSVRSYKEALDEYSNLTGQIEENQIQLDRARQAVSNVVWFFNNQELSTRALEKQDPEVFSRWFQHARDEWNNFAQNRGGYFKAPDQPLNIVLEKTFKSEEPSPNYLNYLLTLLPVLLVLLLLYFMFARQMRGIGGNAMNFGKSPAKLLTKDKNKVTFKDVAGVDEALEELQEIVEFLKNPQKFTALGGHIPKGVLCIGPPGTGKTLIAKAVAGEADRPFFSISGSDFVEMFVGVGASRIRDLFDQAKKHAPCIIFMDEIDAVGRHRGPGIGGGHDEREQTLNQLLVEMDGFDTNEGVILMAATNRPDVLDKALLRPGRFDRRVVLNLPDIKGRYEILKVHAKKIKMDPSVDLMSIARSTPGCSGADLANIMNEAALLAARKERTAVTAQETSEARDKVLYGKERRNLELDEHERKTTAYHESGHAIVSLSVKHADPVDKVTIIPRGVSLGATFFLPKKNKVSYWMNELTDQLAVLMGGRCAEEIFVGDISSGAQQDIERATQLARSMVCEWGMSKKLGAVAYDERSESGQYLGVSGYHEKKYSEETAKAIDDEVRRILDEAYEEAKRIIKERYEHVELMTKMLMEFETLDSDDVNEIILGTWDINKKRDRLKKADELHKKTTGTAPMDASISPQPPPPPSLPSSSLNQAAPQA